MRLLRLTRSLVLVGLVPLGCGADEGSAGEAATEAGSSGAASTTQDATTAATSVGTSAMTAGDSDGSTTAITTTAAPTSDATTSGADTTDSSSDATASTGGSLCDNGSLDETEVDIDCGGDCGPCPTGSFCENPADCESTVCESGSCLGDAEGCEVDDVQGAPGGLGWADSYSVDGRCYCATSFDHNIGEIMVETPAGPRTVMEVCEAIGDGPGIDGHPIYNDVQCGNGPANDAGDEDWCPGRVDQGEGGCCTAGPLWDLSVFER